MNETAGDQSGILLWHVMSFDLEGILPLIASDRGGDPGHISGIVTADSIHRGAASSVSDTHHAFYFRIDR